MCLLGFVLSYSMDESSAFIAKTFVDMMLPLALQITREQLAEVYESVSWRRGGSGSDSLNGSLPAAPEYLEQSE